MQEKPKCPECRSENFVETAKSAANEWNAEQVLGQLEMEGRDDGE